MARWSRWLRLAAGSTVVCAGILAAPLASAGPLDFAKVRSSAEARELVDWVRRSGDAQGRPFAVVDKKSATLYVFDGEGRLAGHSAALLGQAPGDHTLPGVNERTQAGTLTPEDRTTPAGRFESKPGRNHTGEAIVWVDYASAFAIHRLRPGPAEKPRAQRLATLSPDDNRASYGCVVVPVAFYEQVVEPMLGTRRGVVYVLPETVPARALFGALSNS
jgi:hypothetical protein